MAVLLSYYFWLLSICWFLESPHYQVKIRRNDYGDCTTNMTDNVPHTSWESVSVTVYWATRLTASKKVYVVNCGDHLKVTTYLSIAADHINPFLATVYSATLTDGWINAINEMKSPTEMVTETNRHSKLWLPELPLI